MSEYNLLLYYYNKWKKAETNEERMNILVDYIMTTKKNEEYSNFFGIDFDLVDYMDKYEIEDFMEERYDELEKLWKHLIRNYDYDEED